MKISTINDKTRVFLDDEEEIMIISEKYGKSVLVRNSNGLEAIKKWYKPDNTPSYNEVESLVIFREHFDNLLQTYEKDENLYMSTQIEKWMQDVNTYRLIILSEPSLQDAIQTIKDSVGMSILADSHLTNEQAQEMYEEEMFKLSTAYYLLSTEGYEKDNNRIKLFYSPTPEIDEYIKKYVKCP